MSYRQLQPASTNRLAIITPRYTPGPAPFTMLSADQFAAFAQDAIDNQTLVGKGKLTLPVLAIGGDHSYGDHLATEVGFAAANVGGAVISNSGHWIMEEQPQQAIAVIVAFLEEKE